MENKMSMFKVVLFLCEQNLALLALFVSINDLYLLFKQKINELDSLAQQKLLITTGLSVDKKNMKKQLAYLTERIAGAIHSYADGEGNSTLAHEVNYSSTKLKYLRDSAMIEVCRNIYNIAIANATNISGFGIDAVMLQTFVTAIDLFENKSPQPTEAREHGATLTATIKIKSMELSLFLKNRFDKAIHLLTANDPNFVTDYFNSRKIVNAGIRHEKVSEEPEKMAYMRGNITDADGNLLEGVQVVIANDAFNYTDETDEDGDYLHEAIAGGKYTVTISLEDYKTITEVVEFATNDETVMDFVMELDSIGGDDSKH